MNRIPRSFALITLTSFSTIVCQWAIANPDLASASINNKFKTSSIEKKQTAPDLQSSNIRVDNKITDEEKRQYNAIVDQANQYTDDQAAALNKIPGVEVNADDLKEKKKEGIGLNPIKWLFGPVIRLQEQSVQLQQMIMKLTGPIAALQPSMLSLENRMTSMQGQLGNLEKTTNSVQEELKDIRQDMVSIHTTLNEIKKPVTDLKGPIMSLHDPILNIEKPIVGVDKDLTEVKMLLSLVLTAIFAASLIIAVGTPIAAILVWRNREKLLPKPNTKQEHEEERIKQATKTMDHQLKS